MATRKKDTSISSLPTKADILAFIEKSPNRVGKREIARTFNIRGADRPAFKKILKELEEEGRIERGGKRHFAELGRLPEVAVLDAVKIDTDGDLIGQPAGWEQRAPPPVIFIVPSKEMHAAVGVGDRVLARLKLVGDGAYEARPIRKLSGGPRQLLGICEKTDSGGLIIRPISRKERQTITVEKKQTQGARHGEFVLVTVDSGARRGLAKGRVVERIHDAGIVKALSLIAIYSHGIPHEWSAAAMEEAEACGPAKLGQRTDLRRLPLVTIDGEDARDFDDAVWAEPDTNASHEGGWHLVVAIADVAWYVQAESALDRAAFDRGNSTYFPDRVVPMLPEALSNGWCSLRPNEDRPCLAVHMWIDKHGKIVRHKFVRGLMRSQARLTYEQVQAAIEGTTDSTTEPLLKTVIKPLYGAYASLEKARKKRGALALDLPERKILVNDDGEMTGVLPRPRFASHQLIEEFMVAANVAAAQTLQKANAAGVYRVHEPPDPERVSTLQRAVQSMDLKLAPSGSIKAKDFNYILKASKDEPAEALINTMVLRTQSQARYETENLGHFGLALSQYTHFTSPIRRYSDLIVHRSLIRAMNLGQGGLDIPDQDLVAAVEHISMTERRSAGAERETVDRFTAAFLADRVGTTFTGRVNGASRFGLFVTLDDTGADGILPIKRLPSDYYEVFEDIHMLAGRHSGMAFSVGDLITVSLSEADAMTGGLVFDYIEHAPLREKMDAKADPRRNRRKSSKAKRPKSAKRSGGKPTRKKAHK
ncbi:MAG: ribonuclease R [Rhodospirillaceae bacterium]|nr:ribonuclease R [Rhodospirillaceae bacterium]